MLVIIEQLGYDDMLNNFGNGKKEGKDQESIQSSTTSDPGYQWESDSSKLDIRNESQEVSPHGPLYLKPSTLPLNLYLKQS